METSADTGMSVLPAARLAGLASRVGGAAPGRNSGSYIPSGFQRIAFDFDGNEKWRQYRSSLEIPAGKDVEQVLLRFKAKWYRREIDPSFDIDSAQQTNAPAQPQVTTSESQKPAPESAETQRPTSTRTPANGTATAAPKSFFRRLLSLLASSHQERLFFLHAALVVFFVLHLQPFARAWGHRAWAYFMQTALITHGYKVYLKYGAPQLRPFSFAAIRQWTVQSSASSDFQYALLALVFMPSKSILLVMIPIVTLAIYHLFAYASQHFSSYPLWQKYGQASHQWLLARQQQALLYNAAAEIGAGFLVILGLLYPPRSFFLVFIYWQFLRMRFWSPDAGSYHRMAWSQLDAKFGRYLDFIPLLKMPVGYVQRWFQAAPSQ